VEVVAGRRLAGAVDVEALVRRLARAERGLLVAGAQDDPSLPAAVARLAAALDWPVVADPLSLVRCGPHDRSRVVERGDLLLRPGPWRDAHLPEVVVRVGAPPTSRLLLALLEERRPAQLVSDGDGGWREPAIIPTTFVHADAAATAHASRRPRGGRAADGGSRLRPPPARAATWCDAWLAADRAADHASAVAAGPRGRPASCSKGRRFALLGELLTDGAILWASSSMPVRDMDAWLPSGPRAIRPLANRGANGIDGVVSSALGAAATGVPVVLVVGDLALLHDLTGLVAARLQGLSATIVVVHNDGVASSPSCPSHGRRPSAGLPRTTRSSSARRTGVRPRGRGRGPRGGAPPPGRLRPSAAPWPPPSTRPRRVLELRSDRARNAATTMMRRPSSGCPRGAVAATRRRPDERAPPDAVGGILDRPRRGPRAAFLFLHGFSGSGLSWAGSPGWEAGCGPSSPTCPATADRWQVPGGRAGGSLIRGPGVGGATAMTWRRSSCDSAHRASTSSATRWGARRPAPGVAHPDVVGRLVLEAPSAGIATCRPRRPGGGRRGSRPSVVDRGDRAFAARWEASRWMAGEGALPDGVCARQQAIRRANDPLGLAASLVHGGQGAMEPLHDRCRDRRPDARGGRCRRSRPCRAGRGRGRDPPRPAGRHRRRGPRAAPRAPRSLPRRRPRLPPGGSPMTTPATPVAWTPAGEYRDIRYEHSGTGIARVTINRPEVRNAFRPETVGELIDAFARIRDDPSVGCVLLTGEGDKAFCSGGDQRYKSHAGGYVGEDGVAPPQRPRPAAPDRSLPIPVIALVNATRSRRPRPPRRLRPRRFASQNAVFGQVGPRVGSSTAASGSGSWPASSATRRPRRSGSCAPVHGRRGIAMGLVNRVVPLADLEAEGVAWAEESCG